MVEAYSRLDRKRPDFFLCFSLRPSHTSSTCHFRLCSYTSCSLQHRFLPQADPRSHSPTRIHHVITAPHNQLVYAPGPRQLPCGSTGPQCPARCIHPLQQQPTQSICSNSSKLLACVDVPPVLVLLHTMCSRGSTNKSLFHTLDVGSDDEELSPYIAPPSDLPADQWGNRIPDFSQV